MRFGDCCPDYISTCEDISEGWLSMFFAWIRCSAVVGVVYRAYKKNHPWLACSMYFYTYLEVDKNTLLSMLQLAVLEDVVRICLPLNLANAMNIVLDLETVVQITALHVMTTLKVC